jgi:phosphoglycolate phosphatase-like HAD superfamily hydrolase
VKYDVIAIDFVGTLAQLYPEDGEIVSEFLHINNVQASKSEVESALRMAQKSLPYSSIKIRTTEERRAYLIEFNDLTLQLLGCSAGGADLFKHFSATKRHWVLTNGATERKLRALRKFCNALVVASNFDASLSSKLSSLNIFNCFDRLYSSQLMGVEKPKIEFFRRISEAEAANASNFLMIGDSVDLDFVPAREAGWSAILMNCGLQIETSNPPMESVKSFDDLLAILSNSVA